MIRVNRILAVAVPLLSGAAGHAAAQTPAPTPAPTTPAAPQPGTTAAPAPPAPATTPAPSASAAPEVTGAAAWEKLKGNTISGKVAGDVFSEFFDAAGGVKYVDKDGLSTGTWAVQNAKVCFDFPEDDDRSCSTFTVKGNAGSAVDDDGMTTRFEIQPGNAKGL